MGKPEEYRGQSVQELESLIEDRRKELFGMKLKRRETGSFEKPHAVRELRRDIARLITIASEKRRETKE